MSESHDLVVRSPDEKIQLVVEAKTKLQASADWASQMRRNLLRYDMVPSSPYFILALPDRFHVWLDAQGAGTVQPDLVLDTRTVLAAYVNSLKTPLEALSEESFGLIVRTWLEQVVTSGAGQAELPKELRESGLAERIENGRVSAE